MPRLSNTSDTCARNTVIYIPCCYVPNYSSLQGRSRSNGPIVVTCCKVVTLADRQDGSCHASQRGLSILRDPPPRYHIYPYQHNGRAEHVSPLRNDDQPRKVKPTHDQGQQNSVSITYPTVLRCSTMMTTAISTNPRQNGKTKLHIQKNHSVSIDQSISSGIVAAR